MVSYRLLEEAAAPQGKLRPDDKVRAGMYLNKEGKSIDSVVFGEQGPEDRIQLPPHYRLIVGGNAIGQGHVEVEVIENVRVAPSHKMSGLDLVERTAQTSLKRALAQRRSKTVELFDYTRGKALQSGSRIHRNQRKEARQQIDFQRTDRA
ncbi:hypothetical protein ABIC08_009078 [Bradyrhizobium sp. RT9b]